MKWKDFIGSSEVEEKRKDETYYNINKENSNGSKMMLLEPRAFSESQQIADYLKNRHAVVVNLRRVTPDAAKRIIDFLAGTIYAIGGNTEKLGGGIFLFTPNNVNVEGKISDDSKERTVRKKTSEEEDFF